jgi:hypothetical protein
VFAKQMTNVPAACRQSIAPVEDAKGRRDVSEHPRTVALAAHSAAAAN